MKKFNEKIIYYEKNLFIMKKIILIKKKKCLKYSFFKGSSETTREAPFSILQKKTHTTSFFEFDDYLRVAPLHKRNPNLRFLEWFVGFTEGDGTFSVRKGSNGKPRLLFEICQKDPKVLYLIKKTLGFGSVKISKRKGKTYWVYKIHSKKNLQKILFLFNGNLVLTKRKMQFERWLKAAKLWKCLPSPFQKKNFSRFVTVSTKTAWLAGFIDAEGCFYATLSTPSKRSKVSRSMKQKFHIKQKNVYDEKDVLQKIGICFKSKAKVSKAYSKGKQKRITNKTKYFRIEMSSLESHQLLQQYLQKFPLKTQKWINFCRWSRVVQARQMGYHLCEQNLPRLERLCRSINAFTKNLEKER